jgi:Flp pilus assembly protein TadB
MASPPEAPARFTPQQTASSGRRVLVLVVGPLLWLAALVVVGIVARRSDAVGYGLAVTAIAFLVSLCLSALARRRRLREERQ